MISFASPSFAAAAVVSSAFVSVAAAVVSAAAVVADPPEKLLHATRFPIYFPCLYVLHIYFSILDVFQSDFCLFCTFHFILFFVHFLISLLI